MINQELMRQIEALDGPRDGGKIDLRKREQLPAPPSVIFLPEAIDWIISKPRPSRLARAVRVLTPEWVRAVALGFGLAALPVSVIICLN